MASRKPLWPLWQERAHTSNSARLTGILSIIVPCRDSACDLFGHFSAIVISVISVLYSGTLVSHRSYEVLFNGTCTLIYEVDESPVLFSTASCYFKPPAVIPRSLVLAQGNRRPIILLLRQSAFRTSTRLHETNDYVAAHWIQAKHRSCAEGGVASDSS